MDFHDFPMVLGKSGKFLAQISCLRGFLSAALGLRACGPPRAHSMLSTAQKQKELIGAVHVVHIASSTWRHREMMMK